MGFRINDRVRVKKENPDGTRRTPDYIRGKIGIILRSHGLIQGNEHDHSEDWGPLYSVIFDLTDVFASARDGKVVLDLHESWLEVPPRGLREEIKPGRPTK